MCKAFFYVGCRQYKQSEENFSFLTNFMEENLPLESRIPSALKFNNAKIYIIALNTKENKQQVFLSYENIRSYVT